MFLRVIILSLAFSFLQPEKTTDNIIRLFTIGDSTMSNKKPEVYPETGWCQVLSQFFEEEVTIHNHAVNGRSTKSFIDEGRWKLVLDSLKEGDYVFIQFGHNDQKINDSTRYAAPFGAYYDNFKKFVGESRKKGAMPVLFTSIVRRKFGENGKLTHTHGDYPEAVRQVAEKMNVPLIDLQKLTEDWINALGDEPSKKMFLWTEPNDRFPEGRKDDTHLSEKGATEVARMAVDEFKKKKLTLAKYIR
jgi:lysophospholipase L1-like esterase